MNDLIKPSTKIHTIDDAIRLSKKRLPKLVFDFIDGASEMINLLKLIVLH